MAKKITVFLKNTDNKVVITDHDDNCSLEEYEKKLVSCKLDNVLFSMQSDTDLILINPADISVISVSEVKTKNNEYNNIDHTHYDHEQYQNLPELNFDIDNLKTIPESKKEEKEFTPVIEKSDEIVIAEDDEYTPIIDDIIEEEFQNDSVNQSMDNMNFSNYIKNIQNNTIEETAENLNEDQTNENNTPSKKRGRKPKQEINIDPVLEEQI